MQVEVQVLYLSPLTSQLGRDNLLYCVRVKVQVLHKHLIGGIGVHGYYSSLWQEESLLLLMVVKVPNPHLAISDTTLVGVRGPCNK